MALGRRRRAWCGLVEAVAHRVAVDVGVDEDHVDEGVDVVGVMLVRLCSCR